MPRTATIDRKTNETQIKLRLNLDGRGTSKVSTGIRFLDHMLDLVARHGAFDLAVTARGDLDVDQHHTVEDTGIALGEAVAKAVGDKRGILRAGYFLMPMDETLAAAAIDLSGRPHCVVTGKISAKRVGDFQTELTQDFFRDSRRPPAPTSICASSTADLRTIKSKLFLRHSHERCVSRSLATSACAMCFQARKDFCETVHHTHRLRRGQCHQR